jgi:hypothetical protein
LANPVCRENASPQRELERGGVSKMRTTPLVSIGRLLLDASFVSAVDYGVDNLLERQFARAVATQ